ncbi:MAG: cystathionine gamma-synthase [Acidimicrobiia bacterium]|nr:cystathionine gamma-synthase [Acidimicrobiia bacterium]NNJ46637.1 cystathionine gamma-synthase [Acidimicrobiia bacterium]
MKRFETIAIHAGQEPDPTTGAVVTPIYATSTYAQEAPGTFAYEYSRTDNPTRTALQTALAELEGAGAGGGAVATASGMAATALMGYLLKPGDHIVIPNDAYGGTYRFIARVLGEQGIAWTVVDQTDLEAVAAALRPETRLVWAETPTNPLLRVVDIEALAVIAGTGNARLLVDNTFATAYLQQPLSLGADVSLYSTTKYVGGHSDVVGGALVTADGELLEQLRFFQNAAGPVPGPFDAYLTLRGLKTLAIRMDRHCENAEQIARFLVDHPAVGDVYYPGLESHPQHELAARQMSGFGGMISFRTTAGPDVAEKVVAKTELFFLAESLGGVESLVEVPALMTHMSVAGTDLEVPPDLVRLSVGIEHVDDLIADLDQALSG